MPLILSNVRVFPENYLNEKQSLLLPTNMQPLQRSLVADAAVASDLVPMRDIRQVTPKGTLAGVGQVATQFIMTIEKPFDAFQAATLPLVAGASLWLDDPAFFRKLKGRRSVTLINEDTVNPIRWNSAQGAVLDGAILHAAGNISFPMSERGNVHAQATVLAGSQISIIQWA